MKLIINAPSLDPMVERIARELHAAYSFRDRHFNGKPLVVKALRSVFCLSLFEAKQLYEVVFEGLPLRETRLITF